MEIIRFWLSFVAFFKRQISVALFGVVAVASLFHWRSRVMNEWTEPSDTPATADAALNSGRHPAQVPSALKPSPVAGDLRLLDDPIGETGRSVWALPPVGH